MRPMKVRSQLVLLVVGNLLILLALCGAFVRRPDLVVADGEHVDLVIVRKGEKVTVDVRINVVGDAISGNLVILENATVSVEAEATHIPESFEVELAILMKTKPKEEST